MGLLKRNFDLIVFLVLVSGFVFIALQRLGAVPVPETDEAFTLQVPYEMLNRDKLALPMYRYLGGNIENVWHSYTPVYFVLLSAFFKVFGWGLVQGRVFNLITALLTIGMTYLIARRLFNWRAGLIAVTTLISDQIFLERARLLRNDFAAAALAMLAFYLYEVAEDRKQSWLYVVSGLSAGAAVMCHTNALYMIGAIGFLILIRHGFGAFKTKEIYQFSISALALMAYEIVYDIIDYKNFQLQNREDKLHFKLLGQWENVLREIRRYAHWYAGSVVFPSLPRTLLHLFQFLAVIAIAYLLLRCAARLRRGNVFGDPRMRVLLVTVVVVLFLALLGGNKDIYYIAHLAPWFALCVGILFSDGLDWAGRLRSSEWSLARPLHRVIVVFITLVLLAYVVELTRESRRYLKEVHNPDLISFEEVKSVLKSAVPDGVCPIAIKMPVIWLAFPEADRCFATLEERMIGDLDIDGREYALLTKPGRAWVGDVDRKYHLVSELRRTPYGDIDIYYTGANPEYLGLATKRFYFFDWRGGHVTGEQVLRARDVWFAGPAELSRSLNLTDSAISPNGFTIQLPQRDARKNWPMELCSLELNGNTAYEMSIDGTFDIPQLELAVVDEKTGVWITWAPISPQVEPQHMDCVFKTIGANRVRIVLNAFGKRASGPIYLARISMREIGRAQAETEVGR